MFSPFFLYLSLYFKRAEIKKFRPDCLLLSWAYPDAVSGVVLAQALKIPAVIKVHGNDINIHSLYGSRATQIVWAMKKAKYVISVSKALANRLIELGVPEKKIRVIYNGVDKSIFSPKPVVEARELAGVQSQVKLLLYIGNLKKEKGCLDLLEAFTTLAHQDADLVLYYIGNGSLSGEIKSIARASGLDNRIKLLGSLKHDELANWINASNLLVLPSYNEGVPNVLLEAMACGTPVVASRVGGIPEIVPEYAGILHDCGDIESLSLAIKNGLATVWENEKIVESVKELTWENNVNQVHEVLQAAINRE